MSHLVEVGDPEPARLVLASGSPRRLDLCRQLGLEPDVCVRAVDETPWTGESAPDLVLRLALGKAAAVREHLAKDSQTNSSLVVLAADTVISLDGQVLGKPSDQADALAMLARLSARTHTVFSGVAVLHGNRTRQFVVSTDVSLAAIAPETARRYWRTGEPLDKAGAYAIQGLGGQFVERIEGSYSNVVGLPLFETSEALEQAGIRCLPELHSLPGEQR